jgi:hypothetical protein
VYQPLVSVKKNIQFVLHINHINAGTLNVGNHLKKAQLKLNALIILPYYVQMDFVLILLIIAMKKMKKTMLFAKKTES